MSGPRWWHERGQALQAGSIHLSRVRPFAGERQRPGPGNRSGNAAGRRVRAFAELLDAFRRLIHRASLGPIEQRPTMWLEEPPSLVVAPALDADARAARPPDVDLEPTRAGNHSRAAWQPPSRGRGTHTSGRRLAEDAIPGLHPWDERDNVITCGEVDAAQEGQAKPSSRIAELRSGPATWIVVGLGAPTYSSRDPRLGVAATAAAAGRPAVPRRGAFHLPAWKHR